VKTIILGTLAAATVVASLSAASAQNRMNHNWTEVRAQASMEQSWESRRKGISYGYNVRFERSDAVN
jgi:hypothetical protein